MTRADIEKIVAGAEQTHKENRSLREENAQLKLDIRQLEVMLRLQRLSQFAPSSERYTATPLFQASPVKAEPVAEEEKIGIKGYRRRRKKKRAVIPENAIKESIFHDVPATERMCPQHGIELQRGADQKTHQVEWIPAVVKVIEHVMATYCCPICERAVKVAEPPPSPIPGSIATPSLLAHIATSKFADGLPLYRQEGILARAGIQLSRTTLATWMGRLAEHLVPLCNLYSDLLHHSAAIYMDETHLQVLKVEGKSPTSKSYLWVRVGDVDGHRIVLFHFDPTRSGSVPIELLDGYRGYVMTDDYGGYNGIEKMPGIRRLQCWMHVRRYFRKALKLLGKHGQGGVADQALSRIRRLYEIERECADFDVMARHRHRLEFAKPLLADFREWLEIVGVEVPPSGATGRAVSHALSIWEYLTVYLDDGHLLMDNNPAENAIRPVAVGRKNWLFSDSVEGAEATATLYSVIETAKAHGFDPYLYLRIVIERLTIAKTVEDVEALLPWNIKRTQAELPPAGPQAHP